MRVSYTRRVVWLVTVGALALAGSASGAAFTNGGFESASVSPGGFVQRNAGDTSITGWTVRAVNLDYIGTYWVSAEGSRSLDLCGTAAGGIEQTFDTVPGTFYSVTFELAGNMNCAPTVKGVDVGATGNPTAHYTFDTTGHSTLAMGWRREVYSFVASGTSTTLFFQSTDTGSSCGAALDGVTVTAAPPVPAMSHAATATLALLLGACALAALGRRAAI